jgi:integrase
MSANLAIRTDLTAIDRADLAASTKAKYKREIMRYLDTGHKITDTQALAEHAHNISKSSRAFLKAAIRLITGGWAKDLKASATPENVQTVQAALMRFEAIQDAIHVKKTNGKKAHLWLTQKEVKALMALCAPSDLEGLRDWLTLGLLVGAGLRREELVNLRFGALKMMGDRYVLEVKGKGAKDRVIPIKRVLAERIREWRHTMPHVGDDGLIVRSLGMAKELGESMSSVAVFHLVRKYGTKIGKPKLAPHDLRRTYAQLGYEAGVPITQISVLLGHESVATTQRYLDLDLDLETTVSDFIPLE